MQNVKDAANTVVEKVKETASGVSYEGNKAAAKDDSRSAGDRIGHGINAAGDKIEEKGHEAKKEAHKEAAKHGETHEGEGGIINTVVEKTKDAYNYVTEKISEAASAAGYEAHKEQAKDSNETVGSRVGAGINAVGDKIEEKSHCAKAEAAKQQLKH